MINLDSTNKSIELVLADAVTTNELEFVFNYSSIDQASLELLDVGSVSGLSTGTIAITGLSIATTGVSRQLKQATVFNADTVNHNVTIQLNDNGDIRQLAAFSLMANETLQYTEAHGWQVGESGNLILTDFIYDTNGNESLGIIATPDAVNYIDIVNAAAGTALNLSCVQINAAGEDDDVDIQLNAKGDGVIRLDTPIIAQLIAAVANLTGITFDINAAGFAGTNGFVIAYDTGASITTQVAARINIDREEQTAGFAFGLNVSSTESDGASEVYAFGINPGVAPILQLSSDFSDLLVGLVNAVDETTDLNNPAVDTPIFLSDNDTLTVGLDTEYQLIEVVLSTFGSQPSQATFEYSTGVGTWATLVVSDGTNDFEQSGNIVWDEADTPGWAVGATGYYEVRVTRTRNGNYTEPVVSHLQIAGAIVPYSWDKDGNLSVNSVTANSIEGVLGAVTPQAVTASYLRVSDAAAPVAELYHSAGALDEKRSRFYQFSNDLVLDFLDDAFTSARDILRVGRSGITVQDMTYGNSTDNPVHTFHGAISSASQISTTSISSSFGRLLIDSTTPIVNFYDSNGAADEKRSRITANSNGIGIAIRNDADNVSRNVFNATRSADVVTGVELGNSVNAPDVSLWGDLITASGKGIDFAAAGGGVLDYYEEGEFTPVLSDGINNATSSVAVGVFTMVGDLVHAYGRLTISSKGSMSGGVRLGNLPFTSASGANAFSSMLIGRALNANITAGQNISGYLGQSSTSAFLQLWDNSGGATSLQATEILDTFDIMFSVTYKVA